MKITWSLFLFILCANLMAQQVVTLDGPKRAIPSYLLGFNGRSTEGPSWGDEGFLKLVQQMSPNIVRYPAGTQANYWDWRTGTFIAGCGKTSPYTFSIPLFVKGLPSSASVVYVVNMARPTPVTGLAWDDPNTSLAVLEKKIDDMLAALREFERVGNFPIAIELGNEFYFANEHAGIYAANPTLYLQHAAIICQRVKAVYPDLGIILCTTKYGSSGRETWNDAVLSALKTDVVLKNSVKVIVQHHYINDKYGDQTVVSDNASCMRAIAEGLEYTLDCQRDYDLTPDGIELWLTEYGVTKMNAKSTWTAGLRSVSMSLGWLSKGPKITNLLYHHITDDPDVIDKTNMKAGPIGLGFGLLCAAGKGMTHLQPVAISNNSATALNQKALNGFLFSNAEYAVLFLANFSDQRFPAVDVSRLVNPSGSCDIIQHWSERPYELNASDQKGINSSQFSTENRMVDLPPFSVTTIRVKRDLSNSVDHLGANTLSAYPSPFSSGFTLEVDAPWLGARLTIFDLTGQCVFESQVRQTKNLIQFPFPKGIYMLVLNIDGKQQCLKITKK